MNAGRERALHADAAAEQIHERPCARAAGRGQEGTALATVMAADRPPVVRRALLPLLRWLVRQRHPLALVAGFALVGFFALLPIDPAAFQRYGYAGVFVTTLIATGGLVLPVPYLLVVAVAGTVLNPLAVGLVAGLASATGELTGYLIGFAGAPLISRGRWHTTADHWVKRCGFWAVFALAVVPNPLFDAAGVAAGTLGMPLRNFWLACFFGKTLRLVAIAWLASLAPGVLERWLR